MLNQRVFWYKPDRIKHLDNTTGLGSDFAMKILDWIRICTNHRSVRGVCAPVVHVTSRLIPTLVSGVVGFYDVLMIGLSIAGIRTWILFSTKHWSTLTTGKFSSSYAMHNNSARYFLIMTLWGLCASILVRSTKTKNGLNCKIKSCILAGKRTVRFSTHRKIFKGSQSDSNIFVPVLVRI